MIETLFFPFFMGIWIAFMGLAILAFVFWILMLIDCAKRKFKNDNDKIIWIVVLALTGWIGALIYYFVIKKPNKH
ncbi:PLDc N-terminal domain-containing protein [Candidatus Woesearchaeota archaeon]|nr:PLDc N-terminal domain-containing protein [Candidatus Woesearchaeota archaeon]